MCLIKDLLSDIFFIKSLIGSSDISKHPTLNLHLQEAGVGWTIGHVALSNHMQGVSWLDAQSFLQLEIIASPVRSRSMDHVAGRLG